MKNIKLTLIALLISFTSFSQQDPMFSHYMFNGIYLNPAYSGTHDYASASLLMRKQWVGQDGAPSDQFFTIDGPIANRKMGLGLILGNDQIGITKTTRAYADYSYHLPLGQGKLSMGVRGGISYERANFDQLENVEMNDQVYTSGYKRVVLPNAGVGLYYYTNRFYAGLSVPHIINYEDSTFLNATWKDKETNQERHYFLTAGYVFNVNSILDLKPNFLVKYVSNAPLQYDINLSALIKQTLWIGGSYRSGESFTALLGLNVTERLRVGYSYDFGIGRVRKFNNGSHEVMIAYDFTKQKLGVKTPRYF